MKEAEIETEEEPYTVVFTATQIGLMVQNMGGTTVVVSVHPGGEAERLKVQAGSQVLKVSEKNVESHGDTMGRIREGARPLKVQMVLLTPHELMNLGCIVSAQRMEYSGRTFAYEPPVPRQKSSPILVKGDLFKEIDDTPPAVKVAAQSFVLQTNIDFDLRCQDGSILELSPHIMLNFDFRHIVRDVKNSLNTRDIDGKRNRDSMLDLAFKAFRFLTKQFLPFLQKEVEFCFRGTDHRAVMSADETWPLIMNVFVRSLCGEYPVRMEVFEHVDCHAAAIMADSTSEDKLNYELIKNLASRAFDWLHKRGGFLPPEEPDDSHNENENEGGAADSVAPSANEGSSSSSSSDSAADDGGFGGFGGFGVLNLSAFDDVSVALSMAAVHFYENGVRHGEIFYRHPGPVHYSVEAQAGQPITPGQKVSELVRATGIGVGMTLAAAAAPVSLVPAVGFAAIATANSVVRSIRSKTSGGGGAQDKKDKATPEDATEHLSYKTQSGDVVFDFAEGYVNPYSRDADLAVTKHCCYGGGEGTWMILTGGPVVSDTVIVHQPLKLTRASCAEVLSLGCLTAKSRELANEKLQAACTTPAHTCVAPTCRVPRLWYVTS